MGTEIKVINPLISRSENDNSGDNIADRAPDSIRETREDDAGRVRALEKLIESSDDDDIDISLEAKRRLLRQKELTDEPVNGELLQIKLAIEVWRHYLKSGERIRI